jgi:signal transduction histidine kinase
MAVTLRPAEPLVYECRPDALKRAIRNLVDNAVKYGERAEVAIAATAKTITIMVDDHGPGIPEPELARVLEPFYRLEQSRSRETGGVGLGIAIAQSIVHTHGGELRLANRAEGGLRASLKLPR